MCLEILGIHGQRLFQRTDSFLVAALKEQDAPGLIQHHAIPRVLIFHLRQTLERAIVIAIRFLDHGPEEVGAGQFGTQLQRSIGEGRAASFSPSWIRTLATFTQPSG